MLIFGATNHFQELMAFVQMGHDDTLPFGYCAIHTDELAVSPHRVNLMQSELILDDRHGVLALASQSMNVNDVQDRDHVD